MTATIQHFCSLQDDAVRVHYCCHSLNNMKFNRSGHIGKEYQIVINVSKEVIITTISGKSRYILIF